MHELKLTRNNSKARIEVWEYSEHGLTYVTNFSGYNLGAALVVMYKSMTAIPVGEYRIVTETNEETVTLQTALASYLERQADGFPTRIVFAPKNKNMIEVEVTKEISECRWVVVIEVKQTHGRVFQGANENYYLAFSEAAKHLLYSNSPLPDSLNFYIKGMLQNRKKGTLKKHLKIIRKLEKE